MNDNPTPAEQIRDHYVMPDHPALAEFRRMFSRSVKVRAERKVDVEIKLAQISGGKKCGRS